MTEDRMALIELLQKSEDGDFLRSVAEGLLQMLMEADVEGLIGAARHQRSAERLNYRNGYRDRTFETRLGPLSLRIRSCVRARIFRPFWSRAKSPRRHWWRLSRRPGLAACRPAGSMIWCKQWACPASRRARFPSCARTSTSGSRPFWSDRSRANGRICGLTRPA
jgi:hypothetical protein